MGLDYPVTLGPSFRGEQASNLCVLRYDFLPASVNRAGEGVFQQGEGNKVSQLASAMHLSWGMRMIWLGIIIIRGSRYSFV